MPWVAFTANFDWEPPARRGHVVIAYKAGMTVLVAQGCAERAIAKGAARMVQRISDGKRQPGAIPKTDQ